MKLEYRVMVELKKDSSTHNELRNFQFKNYVQFIKEMEKNERRKNLEISEWM